jgi:glycosyltransferase involved in cell wall biosynthesis
MRVALISTVFNEGEDIFRWAEALRKQTRHPDEFVIVDGGSTDGTPERLKQAFNHGDFPAPKIVVQKCNIAGGRNLAIQNTSAEIIATTDAGSYPEPEWLQEITGLIEADATCDIVGGRNVFIVENEFQRQVERLDGPYREPTEGEAHASGRNSAFRRKAWADVGGYPEWLTLTGEDILYNLELQKVGKKFGYARKAMVQWPMRTNERAYFRMMYLYGYGAGEARITPGYFLRRLFIMVFPPLVLLSPHRFACLKFRYRRNVASATGWLAGRFGGRRAPAGWEKFEGILLSPEAQHYRKRTAATHREKD